MTLINAQKFLVKMMRRVGVYVDGNNVELNGGHGMRYDVLRALAGRAGAEVQRLHAYLTYDQRRAERSTDYEAKVKAYQGALRDKGFRVTVKPARRYRDEDGVEIITANAELGMAIDLLAESERLDTVLLVTSDSDFTQVVRALQIKGCRVEVLGFDNVSPDLRDAADQFINGYLIPSLLPVRDSSLDMPSWGQVGSRVRGMCNKFGQQDGYGFIAFWPALPDTPLLAATSTSPVYFRSASVRDASTLAKLPSRNVVLEFDLASPAKQGGAPEARRIQVVSGT